MASRNCGKEKPGFGGVGNGSETPRRPLRFFLPPPPSAQRLCWYWRLPRAALSAASLDEEPGPESLRPRKASRFLALRTVLVGGKSQELLEAALDEVEEEEEEVKEDRCSWSQQQPCSRWVTNSTSPRCSESTPLILMSNPLRV